MRLESTCWKASLYLQHRDVTGVAVGYHSSPFFLHIPLQEPGSQEQEKWQQQHLLHLSSEPSSSGFWEEKEEEKGTQRRAYTQVCQVVSLMEREKALDSTVTTCLFPTGSYRHCADVFVWPCLPVFYHVYPLSCYNWQVVGMGFFFPTPCISSWSFFLCPCS